MNALCINKAPLQHRHGYAYFYYIPLYKEDFMEPLLDLTDVNYTYQISRR